VSPTGIQTPQNREKAAVCQSENATLATGGGKKKGCHWRTKAKGVRGRKKQNNQRIKTVGSTDKRLGGSATEL